MPYMLLVLQPPDVKGSLTDEEGRRRYDAMTGFAKDLAGRGVLTAAESLGSDVTGVRLRGRAGAVIDGPFVEAKEVVGGFFLLDCASRESAVAIARECPAVEWATVEVREVGPCWDGAG